MKIDVWTLALQAINVGLLLWLLQRFLYKPISAVIVQRQQAAAALNAEAEAARAKAEAERAQLAAERAQLVSGREQLLAEARSAAQQQREAILAAATEEVAQRAAAAGKALAQERRDAIEALKRDTATLAVAIARRLLQRLPAAALLDIFLDDVCQQLNALPQAARAALGTHETPLAADFITATALDASAQQHCSQLLAQTLGQPVNCRFQVDASLLAGVELRFQHLLVRNSWAADLDRIRNGLAADEHADAVA